MKFRKLGRTGLDCSTLGFGTWQIGGGRWKGLDDESSVDLLRGSLDEGINIYDAAAVYGQYHGEFGDRRSRSLRLLGQAFGDQTGNRDHVFLCLKLGQLDEMSHRGLYGPHRIVAELNRSLAELQTDFVDICLIHAPSLAEVEDGQALAVIKTIQAMGKARFVGYSFECEPHLIRAATQQNIDVIMFQYNLMDLACENVIGECENRGIGTLIGGPFKRGYLSGRFSCVDDLPLDDHYWKWNVEHCRGRVVEDLRRAMKIKNMLGSAAELRRESLGKILSHSGVTSAIVGHRNLDEVKENSIITRKVERSIL